MDNRQNSTNINWYPGHMAKTKRQIEEDLKLIDVVIEILDARIPRASRNPDILKLIEKKKKIIVLNKMDLAEETETKAWIEYYKSVGINAIAVDSNTGRGIEQVIRLINFIMKEDLQKAEAKGIKNKTIRVMILGIPNVGKSSFINRISKKTSANVGNKPGVTKQKQWIRLSNNIELLDTPGVLWPKFEEKVALNLSYTGTIKDEVLSKVDVVFFLLKYLFKDYKNMICDRYKITDTDLENINNEDDNQEILELMNIIGRKRGAIISGGNVDEEKVANIVIEDFRSGKIGKITLEKVK